MLAELPPAERRAVEADLAGLGILPEQGGFSKSPAEVLAKSEGDPSRQTFAILVDEGYGGPTVVGVGVLQADTADAQVWPSQGPHVVLRGFSIDFRYQGRGIGAAAVSQAVALAECRFPGAEAVVLTVHVDNVAGQRAYERSGFWMAGRRVRGRAGAEHVMVRDLNGAANGASANGAAT
jgi:RimJ/RimL family protein N-acetyltransferase